jgi:hypothetical protein
MHVRDTALSLIVVLTLAGCAGDPASPTMAVDGPSLAYTSATGATIVTENEIVRQAENTPPTGSWVLYTRNAGAGAFRVGPGTAPEGVGSLELATPTGADKLFLFNYGYVGTPLGAIDALGYSTYRTAGSAQQVTALNIEVDHNGADAGGFTTLVFEPVYNTAQGPVVGDAWQSWDAHVDGSAIWWSSRAIPGVCAFDCFVTWDAIVAANPDAVIVGGIGVNQGSGNDGLTAAVDAFTVGVGGASTTYDFEPWVAATTRQACKDDGWQTLKRADGSDFSNQGACVSYVETGR